MKVCVVGGGPAGLYFSISLKRKLPNAQITVFERNAPEVTFGWGVVLSGRTKEALLENDWLSAERLSTACVTWDKIETVLEDDRLATGGYPFHGIDRRTMLQILAKRCIELGVELKYGKEIRPEDSVLDDFDLIVAADGVKSRFRTKYAREFDAVERQGTNKYIWLGTKAVFDRFRFVFKKFESHWIWAHTYPFDNNTSTFIVECSKRAWKEIGFQDFATAKGCNRLAELFCDVLQGQDLLMNGAQLRNAIWQRFRQVDCRHWATRNIVLIGDAAHTIHFSVGSGTRQSFDDAMCLARCLVEEQTLQLALGAYQNTRNAELASLKAKGARSMSWFEEANVYAENLGVGDFERALLNRATMSAYEDAAIAAVR